MTSKNEDVKINNLIKLRKEAGLTQSDLAKILKVSSYTYSRLERNPQRMRADRQAVLAKVFGIKPEDILAEPSDVRQMTAVGLSVPLYDVNHDLLVDTKKHQIYGFKLPENAFSISVNCKSMEDCISLGDIILINPKLSLTPGCIVLAHAPVTKEIVLRFYTPLHTSDERSPGFDLRPANSSYPSITSTKDAPGLIIGRAAHRMHML